MSGRFRRLYYGDTAIDFYGRRKIAFITSFVAVVGISAHAPTPSESWSKMKNGAK